MLAALNIRDCAFLEWAGTSRKPIPTVAIVLSDQFLGQARSVTDPPPTPAGPDRRPAQPAMKLPTYTLASAASPQCNSSTEGCLYTADGLEHNEEHTLGMPQDHQLQPGKAPAKLTAIDGEANTGAESAAAAAISKYALRIIVRAQHSSSRPAADDERTSEVVAIRLLNHCRNSRYDAIDGASADAGCGTEPRWPAVPLPSFAESAAWRGAEAASQSAAGRQVDVNTIADGSSMSGKRHPTPKAKTTNR